MRRHRADLIEIFGGHAAITECAVKHGLRTLQPVDQVYGQQLRSKEDYQKLESILMKWLPFLVIWEPICTAWCSLQHLNYDPEELRRLRELQLASLKAMADTIKRLYAKGVHFLIENPFGTPFWETQPLRELQELPGVTLGRGDMCSFNLRDHQENLLKEPTAWLGSLPEVVQALSIPCKADHPHGQCMGGSVTRKA